MATALVLAGVVVLVAALLAVGGYRVRGPSMEPALADGDLVLANPLLREPARFDAVVYAPSDGIASIKRVIGLPGDQVRITPDADGGLVEVQVGGAGRWSRVIGPPGRPGPGAQNCCAADGRTSSAPAAALVPPGTYFLLGDNRPVSVDSRTHGFVPADRLRGTVAAGPGSAGFALAPS